jgi:hypothetical protein
MTTVNKSFFQVASGISLDGLLNISYGAGAPPTSADLAGSVYIDSNTSIAYISTGSSWLPLASEAYVSNAVSSATAQSAAGTYWKSPVVVADTSTTVLPTFTANTSGSVDGVTVTNGDTVLFLSIGDIYAYDESTGTFTEESPSGVPGDATYVLEGTNAGKTYVYSEASSGWVLFNQIDVTELGYIQKFVGKPGNGSYVPNYTSTNVVTTGSSLVSGISSLDASIGSETTDTLTYTTSGGAIRSNVASLDVALAGVAAKLAGSTSSVSTSTSGTLTIDTAPSGTVAVKWLVYVSDVAGNLASVEVLALNLGGGNVTYTTYGQLNSATAISGLDVAVTTNGSNECVLTVTANDGFSVVAKRETVIS